MAAKLHAFCDSEKLEAYGFHCPGCKCAHVIPVRGDSREFSQRGTVWAWNGSLDAPTFAPSINYTDPGYRCHSFVENGKIRFLHDSDHALAGQTVDLPDWDDPL